MRHAKFDRMGTGISGIYMNYGNYQCLIFSANAMMDDDASSKTYKDTKKTAKLKSENCITRTQEVWQRCKRSIY